MSNPRITFGHLRQLLIDMGFSETVTPKSHVFFAHQTSGAEIALPIYRMNRIVLPHHLVSIRIMLDAKGLMEGTSLMTSWHPWRRLKSRLLDGFFTRVFALERANQTTVNDAQFRDRHNLFAPARHKTVA